MLNLCNIYIFYYVLIHFIVTAVRFPKEAPSRSSGWLWFFIDFVASRVDRQTACRYNLIASQVWLEHG